MRSSAGSYCGVFLVFLTDLSRSGILSSAFEESFNEFLWTFTHIFLVWTWRLQNPKKIIACSPLLVVALVYFCTHIGHFFSCIERFSIFHHEIFHKRSWYYLWEKSILGYPLRGAFWVLSGPFWSISLKC